MRFHRKAFAYRADFSDSVPAAKPFCFSFYMTERSPSALSAFSEHLYFLFSEFRHHGIRHLLVNLRDDGMPAVLSGQVDVDDPVLPLRSCSV